MRAWLRRLPEWARACALALAFVPLAVSPAGAQERVSESAAWDMERAFVEMERLRAEVAVLKGIAAAQAALLAWNRERTETVGPYSGAGPVTLPAHLCREDGLGAWCLALPATFGAGAAEAADNGHGKDGER